MPPKKSYGFSFKLEAVGINSCHKNTQQRILDLISQDNSFFIFVRKQQL
jgi:hypothetical protein